MTISVRVERGATCKKYLHWSDMTSTKSGVTAMREWAWRQRKKGGTQPSPRHVAGIVDGTPALLLCRPHPWKSGITFQVYIVDHRGSLEAPRKEGCCSFIVCRKRGWWFMVTNGGMFARFFAWWWKADGGTLIGGRQMHTRENTMQAYMYVHSTEVPWPVAIHATDIQLYRQDKKHTRPTTRPSSVYM